MKHFAPMIYPVLAGLMLGACQTDKTESTRAVFFDKSGMDTTVNPADDFFSYASGNWMKNTQIPADQTGWGSFYTLYEENLNKLHGILEEGIKTTHPKGSAEQKVSDYYLSGMDTVTIEKKGIEPIKAYLAEIDRLKTPQEIMDYTAGLESPGGVWVGYFVAAD